MSFFTSCWRMLWFCKIEPLLGCVWQIKLVEKKRRKKPFLDERRCTSEANEKMVLEPLSYSSDTP
jgi:hypothetical protein